MDERGRSPRTSPAIPLPTPLLAGLVAATGVALFAWPGRSWAALLAVQAGIIAVAVVDAVRCPSPRRLTVARSMPEVVALGESSSITWIVENHHSRPVRAIVADALWPSLGAEARRHRVAVGATSRLRRSTTFTPTRRGRFPLAAITVRTFGPMRLMAKQVTQPAASSLRVMPAYPSRGEIQRRLRTPRVIDSGARTMRSAGAGTEFDQLREYRPDDEFRRIDWASSIRLQRPIVKQFRTERNQQVVVLLDNGRVMAGTVDGVPRVEHAMDAALAITHVAQHLGDRVGMLTFDRQVRTILPSSNAKHQLGRASEAMFALEPELVESAYRVAFSAATTRFTRRSLYVVLTDLAEATVAEALLPAMPTITRRHLVVVAAVLDPQVTAWADADRSVRALDAFRQAAAVAAIDDRARAAARLRAAGAVVVDARPGELATRLVDTYLELKAAGRL
jgi:uncharacterized protein (DUF58 family)